MEYNQDMKNRLKRIEGQVRGVLRMMEEGKRLPRGYYPVNGISFCT